VCWYGVTSRYNRLGRGKAKDRSKRSLAQFSKTLRNAVHRGLIWVARRQGWEPSGGDCSFEGIGSVRAFCSGIPDDLDRLGIMTAWG